MHELMDAIGTHMRPLLFFMPTTSQRTTNLTIAESFDDYHGEIASLKLSANKKVLQHADDYGKCGRQVLKMLDRVG